MQVESLLTSYRNGSRTPVEVVREVYSRIESEETNAWITVREEADVIAEAQRLPDDPDSRPLYGVPFAVKDNIDYQGLPTTAGCPAYAERPEDHATVVERLIEAGALLIGKTNMDQFATGLVGTRTPYGTPRNVYNETYISGGSSSGSAVAIGRGHVAFALGTDTAGSGRVPAAFNGLVGLKPTRGALSTRGVVPACDSLDCVSVFARTCADALRVERAAAGYDPEDPYSRHEADELSPDERPVESARVGIPTEEERTFFGDTEAERLFEEAAAGIAARFGEPETVDFSPFREAAELLYDGPWVAERFAAVGEFIEGHPDDVDPTVAEIIRGGSTSSAVETFEAFQRLRRLRRRAESILQEIDALVVPTVGTTYTVAEVRANPIELNSNLGYYTNFVNLLDLAAVSVPTGAFDDGPGFGVTVIGDAFDDARVASIGAALRRQQERRATAVPSAV